MRHTSVPRRRQKSVESLRLQQKRLAQDEKRIGELDRLFIRIYEDNVAGQLDDERFAMMSRNYAEEQKTLKAEVKGLQQQIHEQEQQAENIEQFVKRLKRNGILAELTPMPSESFASLFYLFRFHFRQLASASAAWYTNTDS